jgi:ABC-type transport system substrate-binding protein
MTHRLERLTRRQFAALVLGTASAAVLSEACGPGAAPASPTAAPPPAGAAAAAPTAAQTTAAQTVATAVAPGNPTPGSSLVYARNMDTKTLDPAFSAQFSERYALYMIYNTLVAYDKDFNIVPDLAASWTSPLPSTCSPTSSSTTELLAMPRL